MTATTLVSKYFRGVAIQHRIRNIAPRQNRLTAIIVVVISFFSMGGAANLTFSSLETCIDSSYNLSTYGSEDFLAPCILYDIRDFSHSDNVFLPEAIDADNISNSGTSADKTSEITLVQVTPSKCLNQRDGAVTAVKLLNGNNDGMGTAIGFYQDHYVKFRLISIIGGNINYIGDDAYKDNHSILLDSAFDGIDNAHFILGSCSMTSAADKPIALKREKVVISQVGPPGFYMDVNINPYVFGIHVNSDVYPLPALQALHFHLKTTGTATSMQPVRVIYRDKSEFFKSTCRSVIDEAKILGFDVTSIEYDPNGDEDNNGFPNSQNAPFLENLADLLCPSTDGNFTNGTGVDHQLPPAIFACVNGEVDIILERIRSNGCRPALSWFTTATWQWASDNADVVPYFQGAGQWHQNFKYSDNFFSTGQDVLLHGLGEFGYTGSYDHVVSYAIPNLLADLVQSFFRIDDSPNVTDALANRYEDVRKALLYINSQTIFGPVNFNKYQRNVGRGAAGVQWIPSSYADTSLVRDGDLAENNTVEFVLGCMSPLDQADAAIIIPSPSGSLCSPGNYVNRTLIEIEPSLLGKKCSPCPIESYISVENESSQCIACPKGSSTMGESGATSCVLQNPNLIPRGLKCMGCLFVVISWCLAIGYIAWMAMHKNDSVIKIGQPEFLFFICIGAVISTSAIIPLTLAEADVDDDTTRASRNCQAFPFLYSLGWVLMYSSLTAKSYRLTKVAEAANRMQRLKISAKEMYKIIIGFLILDVIILVAWQVVDPFLYIRTRLTVSLDEDSGVVIIESVGRCTSNSIWKFLGPIIAIHVCLMLITNALLWRVRNMSDRYQEQKFVGLASIYICELLLLGVPILVAVQDSAAARYIVIAGLIFLTDTGVLSLIFLPKIKYREEGLPNGMSVVQSMNVLSRYNQESRNCSSRNCSSEYQAENSRSFHSRNNPARNNRDRSEIPRRAVSINSVESDDESKELATKEASVTVIADGLVTIDSDRNTKTIDKSRRTISTNLLEMNDENEDSTSKQSSVAIINDGVDEIHGDDASSNASSVDFLNDMEKANS